MFTGIVEELGIVRSVQQGSLVVSAARVLEETRPGDSIAINGACLTVTALSSDSLSVDVMLETLRRTNLGSLRPGDKVNLERPLTLVGRLGGHLVQGHVDATGKVVSMIPQGVALVAGYAASPEVMRYIVEKGFVAVDGVSLTVIHCDSASFEVSLVGYTRQHTVLGSRRPGDLVNIEVDIIAKYVERFGGKDRSGVTADFLMEHGFL